MIWQFDTSPSVRNSNEEDIINNLAFVAADQVLVYYDLWPEPALDPNSILKNQALSKPSHLAPAMGN